MNWETTKIIEAREEEIQRLGGLAAYRQQALQNLKLKTVVKVWHVRECIYETDCSGKAGAASWQCRRHSWHC